VKCSNPDRLWWQPGCFVKERKQLIEQLLPWCYLSFERKVKPYTFTSCRSSIITLSQAFTNYF
jgi:hypothetical protein